MKKWVVLTGMLASMPTFMTNAAWFENNTALSQAHQHLLTNDLSSMFDSLVEVWQSPSSAAIKDHLNDLLIQSFDVDCGKSLTQQPFPNWIKSLTIRSIEIQSPGRDAYQVVIDTVALSEIKDISLTRWVNSAISQDSSFTEVQRAKPGSSEQAYVKRYNLGASLEMGLYRLIVTVSDNVTWSAWVILNESKKDNTVHWTSKDGWAIKKVAIPNPYCPLPKLNVSIYKYDDGKYSELWHQTYESDYPESVQTTSLPPSRYVLAVSMNHQRWQGPIVIEESQVISKTYDVSSDE